MSEMDVSGIEFGEVLARASRYEELAHWAHRMLQALDAYWMHYEGYHGIGHPLSMSGEEEWWNRYERYRKRVESLLRAV